MENILAQRYASQAMRRIWSEENKILLEREFWICIMQAQKEAGIPISDEALKSYEEAKEQIDLESIIKREKSLKHDVKARLEEFNALAGYEEAHKGLTSRDATENTEQKQIQDSLQIILKKVRASLSLMEKRAIEWKNVVITSRTHNVPAQPTTLGRRIAMFGEELLYAYRQTQFFASQYPIRGIKGAVGTQMDLCSLLENNQEKLQILNLACRKFHCLSEEGKQLENTGQIYPRSLDFQLVSLATQIAAAPSSFSITLRLMAGIELASEGFAKNQTGSSAMPHKKNARSCERIQSFQAILKGLLTTASEISGVQWNEGDVSCSAARRFLLPNTFFALDGLLETFLTILTNMEIYPSKIEKENQTQLPFLSSTSFLIAAIKKGMGREQAHSLIKKNALLAYENEEKNLGTRLAEEKEFPLGIEEIEVIMEKTKENVGEAKNQVEFFVSALKKNSIQENYSPEEIL